MATLEIKKYEGSSGLSAKDYQILVDGHQPTYLKGLELSIGVDQINQATLTFFVEDLKVDGDFLALLKAKVDSNG